MSNPYFQFKQFTIYHDRCAMRVGTDGVLVGIWTDVEGSGRALDIGTGSGLIALMLAQRNPELIIDAIDIDKRTVEQAKENVEASPFSDRIQCDHRSIQVFCQQTDTKYDLIATNSPFFNKSFQSPIEERTMARHTNKLSVSEVIEISAKLLTDNGRLSMIYPFAYKDILFELAKRNNMYVSRLTSVYPTPWSPPKRLLMEMSKTEIPLREDDLLIERQRHVYADDFVELAKDFYLKL